MEENKTFDRLINARNFHYQNFSIWMTFFTVIIGALFVGLYNIDSSKIVLFLAFCITICWGYLLSSNIFCFIGLNHIILFIISSIALTIVLLYLTKFFLKTNMNPLKNLGLNSKNNVNFDELKKN